MKRPRPPYPFLAHEAGPRPGKVWGYWRFTGVNEPPALTWWWHMERSKKEAEKSARYENRWRKRYHGDDWPKAFAAQITVGR